MATKDKEKLESKKETINDSTLEALLSWDGAINLIEHVDIPALPGGRPAMRVGIKALSSREMDRCRDIATLTGKHRVTGNTIKETDDDFSNRMIVYTAIIEPDLSHKSLQAKFNKGKPKADIVDKLFLPGEKMELTRRIYELSGYNMDEDMEHKQDDSDLS